MPGELAHGRFQRLFGLGLDQVQHGLGLGQVKAAVEECPCGKLAGFGQPSAESEAERQDPLQGDDPSMPVDLHHVLPRISARSGHVCSQHLVHDLAHGRLDDVPVV